MSQEPQQASSQAVLMKGSSIQTPTTSRTSKGALTTLTSHFNVRRPMNARNVCVENRRTPPGRGNFQGTQEKTIV
eukprot:1162009-Pelagomonas_calceolata.AAC.9